MVGQPLYRSLRQGFDNGDPRGLSRCLADDAENLIDRAAECVLLRPAGQFFGNGVQAGYACFAVGGDDRIADRIERDSKAFLAVAQRDIGQFELAVRLLLLLEQTDGFEMHETFQP